MPVVTSPRNTSAALAIEFSEPVDLDLAHVSLTRDGVELLTESPASADGMTWTLPEALTAAEGAYVLTVLPGVMDALGNPAEGGSVSWTMDATAPTVVLEVVAPDPRATGVGSLAAVFSEPVGGLTLSDLALTLDGAALPIDAVTTEDGTVWTIALSDLAEGFYLLIVSPSADVLDAAGNALTTGAETGWQVDTTAPTVSIESVPSPRTTSIDSLALSFSESVATISLSLTRDGGSNLLSNGPIAVDGMSWTIADLGPLTAEAGSYALTVAATDAVGNVGNGGTTWTVDLAPPVAAVGSVASPRNTAIASLDISFSEPVSGFDLADLTLSRDGGANLLTGDQSLEGGGDQWTLANLAALTAEPGAYALTLWAGDIADALGNLLVADASTTWIVDLTRPTVDIVDVSPDPRTTAVAEVVIAFSEPVTGFDWTDLLFDLEGDGKGSLLTAAQLLTGDGQTWTLDLSSFVQPGRYTLSFKTATGIVDAAGNALVAPLYDQWTIDTTAPTVDIVDVTPDPRSSWVSPLSIVFSEKVTGFDLGHLSLSRDGGPNLLTAAQTFGSNDQRNWVLGNLAGLTAAEGTYTLGLDPTGITDLAGNPLAAGASDTWTVATFLYVSVGDLRIAFDPRYNYFPAKLERAGLPIFDYGGSTNGVAISLVGVGFVGGQHGNETLESVSLVVDGAAVAVNGAGAYAATEATLTRTTVLGGAYRMVHTLTISAAGIDDHVSMQGLDATKLVDKFYAFLGSRSNRLTDWTAYDEDGNVLATGQAAGDDNAYVGLPAGTWSVAQYDPAALDGVLTEWEVPDLGPVAFITDRPTDNKLYLDLHGLYGAADESLEFSHRLRFF
jgi:hypothetical protein